MKETRLFHVTSEDIIQSISTYGIRPNCYFSDNDELSGYYAETISDEGKKPVILQIPYEVFSTELLMPDMPGIEEPITTVIGMSEEEVQDEWESSSQTWKDSLSIIGSIKYGGTISPDIVLVEVGDDVMPLLDYARLLNPELPKGKRPKP